MISQTERTEVMQNESEQTESERVAPVTKDATKVDLTESTEILMRVVNILQPLSDEDRRRIMRTISVYFGLPINWNRR